VSEETADRRDFLKKTATSIAAIPLNDVDTESATIEAKDEKFQPEEFSRERMKAPDDGKVTAGFSVLAVAVTLVAT
jgi:hypothetical protein